MNYRTTKTQTREKEAHVSALISELRAQGEPDMIDLAVKLARCQTEREDYRAGLFARASYHCRAAGCPFCHSFRAAKWQQMAADRVASVAGESASIFTVSLRTCDSMSAVHDATRSLRRRLRNLRDRRAAADGRYRNMSLSGLVSPHPMRGGHVAPSFSAVMSHPRIQRHAIESTLMHLFQRSRVSMRPCPTSPADQARALAAEALQCQTTAKLDLTHEAKICTWLHRTRCGAMHLRVAISPMGARQQAEDDMTDDTEAMPVLFGWWY